MKRSITSQVRIRRSPKDIIDALVNLDKLKEWWGVDSGLIQKKDGGLYTLTWMRNEDGIKFISSGQINLYNFRSHLYLEKVVYLNYQKPILGPFTIKYDVTEKDTYSLLTVVQGGFEKGGVWDWYFDATSEGWGQALSMLKMYLEKEIN
ncbi:MAG: SRPBCC domain-containing protein [Saprospiraceae bacterium]|nr:SRPBCC domain-containing protein [Bacteroidia bacterium]NNE15539.1 SRPBCC domain-containing protein [Saprospiraceae bacterium]NNL92566.1 SRPBCC domain-containing protein [Saprospiraceae bacterium]